MQSQREAGVAAVETATAIGRMAGGSAWGRPGKGGCRGAELGV